MSPLDNLSPPKKKSDEGVEANLKNMGIFLIYLQKAP
jgi:hypothetical protein